MKLDWNKIISNALTVLVTATFCGAARQLWDGYQTIDARIESNLAEIKATQEVLTSQVDLLTGKLGEVLPLIIQDGSFDKPGKGTKELINDRVQQQARQAAPGRR